MSADTWHPKGEDTQQTQPPTQKARGRVMVFIDTFSALDDLIGGQVTPLSLLSALNTAGRFSAFEMEGTKANALNQIQANGWVEFDDSPYPWTGVTLTTKGREALKAARSASVGNAAPEGSQQQSNREAM